MQKISHMVRHVDRLRVSGLILCEPMKRGIWLEAMNVEV